MFIRRQSRREIVAGQARHRIVVGSDWFLADKLYSPIAQGISVLF